MIFNDLLISRWLLLIMGGKFCIVPDLTVGDTNHSVYLFRALVFNDSLFLSYTYVEHVDFFLNTYNFFQLKFNIYINP